MNNKKKYPKFLTESFELDTDEKKQAGLAIISERQNRVQDLKDESSRLLDAIRKESPELNSELIKIEKELARQKKHLKESLGGLKKEPFTVVADVMVQPALQMGLLEFIENTGTGIVLLEVPGTPDQIIIPEETETEE